MTGDAFEAWRLRAAGADILDVATRLLGVTFKGKGKRERAGACPRCGGDDRFSVNTQKQVFNCRGAAGGDVIAMVMHARAVPFMAACEIITGEAPPAKGSQLTPAMREAAERELAAAADRAARREADHNLYRERARRTAFDIWTRAHPLAGSSAEQYLALRGLSFPPTAEGREQRLKCVEGMPYFASEGKDAEILHRGPAMAAPIVDSSRKFRGLHLTYIDLTDAKGKLRLPDPATPGAFLEAKKARGSKQGNRVELIGPREPRRLVLGEGIEKVLAVWRALAWRVETVASLREARADELAGIAFWSACDLGNLAGAAVDSLRHPTLKNKAGRAASVAGLVPDLSKPGLDIPDSVTDLVLLGDTTSDEFTTRAAMCRAAARYAAPGRIVRVAWPPAAADFDDLLRLAGNDDERAQAARRICDIIDQAAAPIAPALADQAAARRRDSGEQRAAKSTGDGAAGVPIDLAPGAAVAIAKQDNDPNGERSADLSALTAAAAAGAASATDEETHSSRMGANASRWADRTQWQGPPRRYGEGEGALDRWLAKFPLTDLGNIERFVARQRGRLIFCEAFGWLWWDGRRWSREGASGRAILAEHQTVRAIQREAEAIRGTDDDIRIGGDDDEPVYLSDKLAAWGRTSENASRLNPISKRAASSLSIEPHQLDADSFKINLANGTLVVRRVFTAADGDWQAWQRVSQSIRIKPHDPDDYITKISPVRWDGRASCPTYDKFMDLVQPSKDMQRFIDDWDGYSLTGDASEQALVFHHGKGKNGKSTQIAIKLYIAGDYGRSIPIETFAQEGRARQAGQATPDLAMLHRVRVLSTSEPQKNWRLDEALIKVLTGGDEVPVRELHRSYFMLRPEFKLGMNGNYKPRIDGGEKESGMWRRLKLVPWGVTIPRERRDKHFGELLKAEAAGILNRMLAGLERWFLKGLVDAREIEEATEQFRQQSDPLGRFLEFCTKPSKDGRVQTTALHRLFVAWARAFGEQEWKANGFGRAMTERGYISKKSDLNYWIGIEMTKHESDFIDSSGEPLSLGDDAGAGSDQHDGPREAPRPARRREREPGEDENEVY